VTRLAARRAVAGAVLLGLAGCAGSSRVAGPRPDAPAEAAAAPAAADTTVAEAPPPKTTARPEAISPPEPTPAPAPAAHAAGAPADPEVAVGIGEAEKADLEAQARKDLAEAEEVLRALRVESLGGDRSEQVRTVQSLIGAARDALATDPVAAATLARKARLLAGELSPG
jgi:hypothetical protein